MIIPIDRFSRSGATPLPLRSARLLGLAVLAILGAACAILLAMRGAPFMWLFDAHGDFTDFYGAAQALQHGRNPYSVPLYHYLPALTQALRPLILLGQQQAYVVWVALLAACQAGAIALLARRFGRHALSGAVALSPMLILAVMVAQPVAFVVLALAGVMFALEQERYTLAGILLTAAWLKPQLALPAACLFALSRPRVLGGFGAASLILLACPSLPDWLHKLRAFNIEDERVQASLAGVWPGVFGSHHPGYLVVAAGALVASAFALKRGGPPVHKLALLLLIWFVAAPYSHAYDTTMLIVPLAVLGAYPSVLLVDCWVAAALSFYSLSTAVIVAPLLLIGYVAKRVASD